MVENLSRPTIVGAQISGEEGTEKAIEFVTKMEELLNSGTSIPYEQTQTHLSILNQISRLSTNKIKVIPVAANGRGEPRKLAIEDQLQVDEIEMYDKTILTPVYMFSTFLTRVDGGARHSDQVTRNKDGQHRLAVHVL